MLVETFLACALSTQPLFFPHHLNRDDANLLHQLTYAWRASHTERPPILFAYNYMERAEALRKYGIRAYSMTITLSGGHLKGLVEDMPFLSESLAMVVLMQPLSLFEIAQTLDSIAYGGFLLIEDKNMPREGIGFLMNRGFQVTPIYWREHRAYRRTKPKLINNRPFKEAA